MNKAEALTDTLAAFFPSLTPSILASTPMAVAYEDAEECRNGDCKSAHRRRKQPRLSPYLLNAADNMTFAPCAGAVFVDMV